jgi:hypothetical protein
MVFLEMILSLLGVTSASSGLGESMRESKALTIMVIVGMLLFAGFMLLVFHLAGKQ